MSVTTNTSLSVVSTSRETSILISRYSYLSFITEAPAAIGPYSQAIKTGDLLFCSGCIPLDPSTAQIVEGGIEAQTEQVLKNLKAVVEAGGSELGKVVKTTVGPAPISLVDPFDRIDHRPCLSLSGLLEINGRLRGSQWHLR